MSEAKPRGAWLPALALTRTVTARMMLVALIVLGIFVLRAMPVELIPSGFTPPFLFVQVPTLAASPADMEVRLTQPGEEESFTLYDVRRFVEKPARETAEDYIASGDYYWNAGMFVWTVEVIEKAFADYTPGLHHGLLKVSRGLGEGASLEELLEEFYPELDKISIDYAIMEKSPLVATIEAGFDWDDVGSWPAVSHHFPGDEKGNVIRGQGVVQDGSNNLLFGEQGHTVTAIGVDNLIIVQTPDATLVCPRDRAQDIKKLVVELGQSEKLKGLL